MIAKVPFVDVLSTMLDASLPLTVTEYEEWGDPNEETAYRYMRSIRRTTTWSGSHIRIC